MAYTIGGPVDFLNEAAGRLGQGLHLGPTSDNDGMNLSGPSGGSRDLTNYFGNNWSQYPRGSSFEMTTERGTKRPHMDADFISIAPFGGRTKKARLSVDEGGLGGDMSYGIIDSLNRMSSSSRGSASAAVNIFGYPRSSDTSYKATIGFLSNPTIPGNETVLKKMVNYELPGQHDIVVMRNHLPSERQYYKESGMDAGFIDETPRTAFTIPGFNHWLISRQHRYKTPKEYLRSMGKAQANGVDTNVNFDPVANTNVPWHIHGADDILRFFHIAGPIDTENFENNVSSVDYMSEALDQQRVNSNNKKVNLIKYGRADVFNIWGGGLDVGTELGFIIKRVPRAKAYRVDTTRDMTTGDVNFMTHTMLVHPDAMDIDDDGVQQRQRPQVVSQFSNEPWQIIPYAKNGNKGPTTAELEYTDPLGQTCYGVYVSYGYVMKEDYLTTNDNQSMMASDLSAVHNRNILDMYFFS